MSITVTWLSVLLVLFLTVFSYVIDKRFIFLSGLGWLYVSNQVLAQLAPFWALMGLAMGMILLMDGAWEYVPERL